MNLANAETWIEPPAPPDEEQRLASLCALNVLDGPAVPELDRITRLAARLFDVPMALVSLVDKERQWFMSRIGVLASQTARNISFCGHAILGRGPLVVEDATQDRRFAGNPLVTGEMHVRFYAGQPIRSRAGHALGTICLIDTHARHLSEDDLLALNDFALMVEQYFHAAEIDAEARRYQQRYTRSETLLNSTFAQAAVGMALLSFEGAWLQVNPRLCEMLGYSEHDLLQTSFQQLTYPEDLAADLVQVQQLLAGKIATYTMDKRYLHANGAIIWGELTVSLMRDQHGQPLHFLSVINDINERKHAQEALARLHDELESRVRSRTCELEAALLQLQLAKRDAEASAERFISAAESHLDAYTMFSSVRDDSGQVTDFRFVYVNEVAQRFLELPRERILGQLLSTTMPQHLAPGMLDKFIHTANSGQPLAEQFTLDGGHGHLRWIYQEVVKVGDGISVSARDISERIRAEEALRLKEAMLRQLTDAIPAVVAFVDAEQRYRYCNLAYFQSFTPAQQQKQIIGNTVCEFLGEAIYQPLREHIELALQGASVAFDHRRLKDGQLRLFQVHYLPQRESDGQVTGFYIVGWDVTDQRLREDNLRDRATIDELSGLPNRSAFMALLEERQLRVPPVNEGLAVLFLDIDYFKQVNDQYGHAVGDELIREFARRTRRAVRSADVVARLGGDEFVVLLPQLASKADAERVAEKILQTMREPAMLQSLVYQISSSIGVAYASAAAAPHYSAAALLAQADEALYAAKAAGRGCWRARELAG